MSNIVLRDASASKKEVVMNEVFTKVVKLCVEAKVSMRNVMSATLNPALTAL